MNHMRSNWNHSWVIRIIEAIQIDTQKHFFLFSRLYARNMSDKISWIYQKRSFVFPFSCKRSIVLQTTSSRGQSKTNFGRMPEKHFLSWSWGTFLFRSRGTLFDLRYLASNQTIEAIIWKTSKSFTSSLSFHCILGYQGNRDGPNDRMETRI